MEADVFLALDAVAGEVARRYARRCWWASEEDLRQEAFTTSLEVVRGVPELTVDGARALAWRVSIRRVGRYLWEQSLAVTAPLNHLPKDQRGALRGVPVPDGDEAPGALATRLAVDPCADLLPRRAAVELRFWAVAARAGAVDDWAVAAKRVLVDGERPGAVARSMGLPIGPTYRAIERHKAAFVGDAGARAVAAAWVGG